jgi:hypothetical protein
LSRVIGSAAQGRGSAWGLAAVVIACAVVGIGCGDDDDDDATPTTTGAVEQSASPTSESEAVEQLGLETVKAGDLNADFTLPGSDCVASSLFFGADTAAEQEGAKGVVIAGSGDWGVVLATDSETPDCISEWQDAMG